MYLAGSDEEPAGFAVGPDEWRGVFTCIIRVTEQPFDSSFSITALRR